MAITCTFSSLKSSAELCHLYRNRKVFVQSWNCIKKKGSCVFRFHITVSQMEQTPEYHGLIEEGSALLSLE